VERSKVKSYLEVATNIAVLIVAMIVVGVFAQSYFFGGPPTIKAGLQRGSTLAALPKLNYSSSGKTLIIALNTECSYCTESLSFYKRLAETQPAGNNALRIVAIFPNSEDDVRRYAAHNQLRLEIISAVDFRALNLVATPTLVVVDQSGRILDFWVGKLSESNEQQVIESVTAIKS
jgi:peroxiredoxin